MGESKFEEKLKFAAYYRSSEMIILDKRSTHLNNYCTLDCFERPIQKVVSHINIFHIPVSLRNPKEFEDKKKGGERKARKQEIMRDNTGSTLKSEDNSFKILLKFIKSRA